MGNYTNMNKFVISFLLITAFLAVSCSDDEPKDVVNEIKMSVSAETGTYIPWGSDIPVECMLVMSEDNPGVWEPLGFNSIKWFHYCPEKFYHKVGCSTEPASGTLTGVVG